ncbi:MAG: hypothetical protein RL722_329, partial [Pseudomonadota bacterium]
MALPATPHRPRPGAAPLSAQAQRGLSLMELVITLALLGLLAALAAP